MNEKIPKNMENILPATLVTGSRNVINNVIKDDTVGKTTDPSNLTMFPKEKYPIIGFP